MSQLLNSVCVGYVYECILKVIGSVVDDIIVASSYTQPLSAALLISTWINVK